MPDTALQEAERFLHPVLNRGDFVRAKTVSIVDKIFEEFPVGLSSTETKADGVVGQGLLFLERIQQEILQDKGKDDSSLDTPALRRIIDALLDLVSLEGIYPRLLPGAGAPIERRVQSVLQGGVSIAEVKDEHEIDDGKLGLLVDRLYRILISSQGIALAMQQRTLVDVLAALLQLVHGSTSQQQNDWTGKFNDLINSLSPTILFPCLISLLHSTTPPWLKSLVTVPLSLLPMRADGVRQTITFVAKSTPQRPAQDIETGSHSGTGPSLPLEVLSQISKVLSSIPGTITAEEYFDSVAPQLYTLLEDQDRDAQRAAVYTVSHGVLGKRALGAPGAVGWRYLAEPLLASIDPLVAGPVQGNIPHLERRQALDLLTTILSNFSNPGLSKRLLGSIVLPLWAISCSMESEAMENRMALSLLKLYFHTVVGSKGLLLIADNLMYSLNTRHTTDDESVQGMSPSSNELTRPSTITRSTRYTDMVLPPDVDEMIRRSTIFTELIKACPSDEGMGEFFATVLKVSLRGSVMTQRAESSSVDDTKYLIYTHIAQAMIKEVGPQIMANASIGLYVIEEVLRSQTSTIQSTGPEKIASITRLSLETIVQGNETKHGKDSPGDLENTLSLCLPWLTVVLQQETSPELEKIKERVGSVQVLLETFLYANTISRTTKEALRSTITLLSEAGSSSMSSEHTKSVKLDEDVKLHANALRNLQATEIPVRVQGLSELEKLVLRGSSLVSVSSAVLTVLALLQDQDSFVYLSAVKTLVKLAEEDPQSTIRTLQEAYQDITEQSTIDVRLRTGEAIQTIVEEIGRSLTATTVSSLVQLLLQMSSRRRLRTKTNQDQIPSVVSQSTEHQEEDGVSDIEINELKAERDAEIILQSWQGKSGAEDLRLRTSALAILGSIFEYARFSITSLFLNPTLELIIRILNGEKGQQNAIIRRAATTTVLSMVKGAENQQSDSTSMVSNANAEDIMSLQTIDTVFATIASEDEDEIVRGHAEELVKAIQEWREESFAQLLRGDTIQLGLADSTGNTQLRGIDLNLNANTAPRNPDIRKVQELD